jgi:hypothetical protein
MNRHVTYLMIPMAPEELCAPVDEVENFNRRVRDPAARIVR